MIDPDADGEWGLSDWIWAAACWVALLACIAALLWTLIDDGKPVY